MPKPEPPSAEEQNMPVWITDGGLDPAWLREKLNDVSIERATIEDISNATRKGDKPSDGATLKISIVRGSSRECNDDNNDDDKGGAYTPNTIVLKQTPKTSRGIGTSRSLGLAREALFYRHLGSQLAGDDLSIPTVYYAHGNMETGEKAILMEDLSSSCLDSGVLFGPGNPNNWNRDLPALIGGAYGEAGPPPASMVAEITFRAIAGVHARFWRDTTLLGEPWLRGSEWLKGEGRAAWEASQGLIKGIYEAGIETKLESWDPLVKEILEHAMDGISWEARLERWNAAESNWTLVHGDFWPGNVLLSKDVTADTGIGVNVVGGVKVLDWEMVGLGSGPQDLGQYVLSNMETEERRDCEEGLVRAYWEELIDHGVDAGAFPWDECWREYRIGGVERFLWFLVYFCGQPDGSPLLRWGQFFHDQIAGFVRDHDLRPCDFVQPRP